MALRTLYTTSKAPADCRRCHAALPADSAPNRLLCDRCRELRRVETFLAQARTIAESLDYDSSLAAAIRVACKRAVGS